MICVVNTTVIIRYTYFIYIFNINNKTYNTTCRKVKITLQR